MRQDKETGRERAEKIESRRNEGQAELTALVDEAQKLAWDLWRIGYANGGAEEASRLIRLADRLVRIGWNQNIAAGKATER
jgi:hypothetical protein